MDEVTTPERLTSFPNLTGRRLPERNDQQRPRAYHLWHYNLDGLSQEILAASWSILLERYTGIDQPAFRIDNRTVYIHHPRSVQRQIRELKITFETRDATGLFFNDVSTSMEQYALVLTLDFKMSDCRLTSSTKIPSDFLEQIAVQFMAVVEEVKLQNYVARSHKPRLSVLNPNPKLFKGPATLHGLIHESTDKQDIAIEYHPSHGTPLRLSYVDLHERADDLSRRILQGLARSTTRHPVVPLMIPQHPHLYISQLAILKSGGTFCPINLDAPSERIKFIIEDTQAKVLLTTTNLRPQLAALESMLEVICVDSPRANQHDQPVFTASSLDPSSPAYVMYTSGSTGIPKGVPISHRAATQALLAHDVHVPKFRRFLQFASPTFDVSVFEIFFPLFRGSTLVCSDRERLLGDLPGAINELEVDAVELTPTVAGTLVRSRRNVPHLKILLSIGEMLTERVVNEFGAGQGDDNGVLLAVYGPTESTIHCTIEPYISRGSVVGNIGQPLDSVSAFVLSSGDLLKGQTPYILPIGYVGELAVGGHQLAQGYLNRPEQTEAAFIDLPGYGQVYRTGDKVRLLPNGRLECLGRIANTQVKLRGQRIELGEIEATAYRVSGVDLACAAVIDGALVIFCTSSSKVSADTIMLECQRWLPRFMRPSEIVMLKDVPRLPSGKADRNSLENDHRARKSQSGEDYESEVQRQLASIIGSELGTLVRREDRLAIHGLDSLRAIVISSRLRSNGFHLSAMELLEGPTIDAIAALIDGKVDEKPPVDRSAVSKRRRNIEAEVRDQASNESSNIESVDICTPMQNAMLSETLTDSMLNCNWFEIQFSKSVGLGQLRRALQALSSANDILRSGFMIVERLSTFARVIWHELPASHISFVEDFDYARHTKAGFSITTPLTCQLLKCGRKALFHAHHAIFDGWSLDQMMVDLEQALYGGTLAERPSYSHVSQFYAEYAGSKNYVQAQNYWRSKLENIKISYFPMLCPTKPSTTSTLCVKQTSRVKLHTIDQVAKTLGVSRPSVLMAAYAFLLARYAGTAEPLFGVVSSGRTLPVVGIESILGPCLTTLPTSIELSQVRTVHDLILLCHRANRDALAHELIPLTEMKRLSGIPANEQLFDSLFVWQESPASQLHNSGGISVVDSLDHLRFSLILEAEPRADELFLKLTFNTSVLPIQQAETLCLQLDILLDLFVGKGNEILENATDGFSHQQALLSVDNLDFVSCKQPRFEMIHNLEERAVKQPQAPALQFVDDFDPTTGALRSSALSYSELNGRADGLASYLQANDCGPNDLIAVWMEKSVEFYVCLLAIIKCGSAFLPLDPRTPYKRAAQIMTEAQVRLVLSMSSFKDAHQLPNGKKVVAVDQQLQPTSRRATENVRTKGSDLAYAVFTSGTTGTPKGVLVTRENITSNIETLSRTYPTTNDAKLLQSCSPAFDVSVFEIFFTWHQGMCLVSSRNDVLFRSMEAFICATKITHLSLTPSVADVIERRKVPNVRFMVVAGEPIKAKVFRDWADGNCLYQGYGPAETTNICTLHPRMNQTDVPNNIGRSLANTSSFVIEDSEAFRVVPQGTVGELCFGGDQVCRGYLNSPTLTSEKFISHPKYGWLYRTGDIGRMLIDGSLQILGRKDDQVKVRGQRVELREIDQAMMHQKGVANSATFLIKSEAELPDRIVSFYTSQSQSSVDLSKSDILQALSDYLPSYMMPDNLVQVHGLPTTVQGKIDVRGLRSKYAELGSDLANRASNKNLRPLTDIETAIADAVVKICNVSIDEIDPETSLMSLGLDSIKSIGFSRKLRELGFSQVDVSTIMRHNCVAALARAISQVPLSKHEVHAVALSDFLDGHVSKKIDNNFSRNGLKVQKILPCTPLQETMVTESLAQNSVEYKNETMLTVWGDVQRLRAAWEIMVQRHEILRTCFVPTENIDFPIVQVVLQDYALPWSSKSKVNGVVDHITENETLRPPYELQLQHSGYDQKMRLRITMHHALYDAEGFAVLMREVEAVYNGKVLSSPPIFETYLIKVISARKSQSLKYWTKFLTGYRPRLLVDNLSSDKHTERGYGSLKHASRIPLSSLQVASSAMGVNLSDIFQASWTRLLSYLLSADDICFGNVYSGRDTPGTESLVGPCFNTLPIRVRLGPRMTNLALVKTLHATNLDILPLQATSLRRIQTEGRFQSRRLFDTMLLIQQHQSSLDRSLWKIDSENGNMPFPFILEIMPEHGTGNVSLCAHWDVSKISTDLVQSLLESFDEILQNTISFGHSQCSDMSFLDGKHVFLEEYQNLPRSTTINGVFSKISQDEVFTNGTGNLLQVVKNVITTLVPAIAVEEIAATKTIFQLGLDSINAFQMAAQFKKRGFSIDAADMLDAATLQDIAKSLHTNSATSDKEKAAVNFETFQVKHLSAICKRLDLDVNDVQSVRPCTKAQSGMLAKFLNSKSNTYMNTIEYEISSDVAITCRAWRKVAKNHEMLRTGFTQTDDQAHPFAMITYHAKDMVLPFMKNIDLDPHQMAQEVRSSLHRHPWRISIQGRRVKLSVHHAMYDAQSLQTLLHDFYQLSSGKTVSSSPIKPLLGLLLKADLEGERSRSYWEERASDMQPSKFPNLHTHIGQKSSFDKVVTSGGKSMQGISLGCRRAGITIHTAGQAAWARVLSAYTGETNVTFGVVISTRPSEDDMQSVIFPCVNTLPVSANVSVANKKLLEMLSKHNAELLRRPSTSLSSIQRWVHIQQPLFDTVFVYQKLIDEISSTGSVLEMKDEIANTEYVLSLELIPKPTGSLDLCLTFDNSLLPRGQAELVLEQFKFLFLEVIASHTPQVTHLPSSHDRLLSVLPAKEERIPSPIKTLHEFIERTALRHHDKVALEFVDVIGTTGTSKREWTYQELNSEGNRFANMLRSYGCPAGELIAICFDKCPEASFAILGILKAGCAFVALDSTAPMSRKEYILEDAGCRFLMTTSDKVDSFSQVERVRVLVVNDERVLNGFDNERLRLESDISSSDVCYCLYTSGTTGNPKGCLISHDNAVQFILFFQRMFTGRWNQESRFLQFASFHFDVSVMEQFFPWSIGICMVSTPRDVLLEDLAVNIAKLDITHMDLTPSLARLVTPKDAPSLCKGVLITGGELLMKEVLEAWGDYSVIYNGYGPSEVTIGCTMHPRVTKSVKPSNIGPQYDNVGSYVMTPGTDEPVLRGAIGELCLTGPLVGIGYLNRPELTAERFPTLQRTGEKMYRTGDLVRLLRDDTFEFMGRIDDQVKLRGQRLEIGEINEVVRNATTRVKDITTLILKHQTQPKEQLVTFFTTSDVSAKDAVKPLLQKPQLEIAKEIKVGIMEKLPSYMIPSFIIPISRMPLSSNNKVEARVLKALFEGIDRDNLRKATEAYHAVDQVSQENISKIQHTLAQTLNLESAYIKPSSSFFELGLDSISAIGFARRLKTKGFIQVHPSMVMKYSTVVGLASALQPSNGRHIEIDASVKASEQRILAFAHKHSLSITRSLGIKGNNIEAIAPVTALQAGMISKTMQTDQPVYHSTFAFELSPDVDLERLEEAWSTARDHLQILRTRFVSTEDGYAQVVVTPQEGHKFWTTVAEDQNQLLPKVVEEWIRGDSATLDKELWKIHLVTTSFARTMNFSLFHGLYDGISLDLLLDYVGVLYRDRNTENKSQKFIEALPHGPLCEIPEAKEFWQQQMLPHVSLDLEAPPKPRMICVKGSIPKSKELYYRRNALKVTEAAMFHACWLLTLFQCFEVHPTHGLIVSGRAIDLEEAEAVIGPMFNTLPCYINTTDLSTLEDLVSSCHNFNTSVIPFQHTPLRDVMKWQQRSASDPLFDSLFVFQRENTASPAADILWTMRGSNASLDYPLAVEVEQRTDSSFILTLVADTPSIDQSRAEGLLEALKGNIESLVRNSNQPLPEGITIGPRASSRIDQAPHLNGHKEDTLDYEMAEEVRHVQYQVAKLADMVPDEVRPTSSIFEFGLDSIDAIKLSARLKESGFVISMSHIMQLRTIDEIAARCTRLQNPSTSLPRQSLIDVKTTKRLLRNQRISETDVVKLRPATPLQEGLVSSMVASKFQQYYSHEILQVDAGIDTSRLLASFDAVIEANDILRTRFIEVDDPRSSITYAQVVTKPKKPKRAIVYLETVAELNNIVIEARQIAGSKGLDQDMFSITPIVIGSNSFLLVSMSHALHDGISLAMLHHDVAAQYDGGCPQRPDNDTFIADSLRQSGDDALNFWRDQLSGIRPSKFAVKDGLFTNHRIEHQSQFPVSKVSRFCRSENITTQTLGLTCWLLVLAHRLQTLDVCSGLVLSGRTSNEAEDIMFPTMNTVAFRSVIHGSCSDMLHYVQDISARTSEFQHFPLRKARAAANISEHPFDSLFLYQRRPAELSHHRELYKSRDVSANTEYRVNVEWELMDDDLVFRTACSTAVFEITEMKDLLKDMDRVLSFVLKDPSLPVLTFQEQKISICDSLKFTLTEAPIAVDFRAFEDSPEMNGTQVPPFEATIKKVFSRTANVPLEELTKNTSLFEIGLDSISAIKVSSLLRKKRIRLTVSDMMKAITIREMALAATELSTEQTTLKTQASDDRLHTPSRTTLAQHLNIDESEIETVLPATAGQVYMLQVWKNADEDPRFYPTFHYRVDGNISRSALEVAWSRLCEQTPMLRTIFTTSVTEDIQLSQVILCKVQSLIRWVPQAQSSHSSNRLVSPVRLLAKVKADHTILALQLHHALYDAMSLPLILSGFQQLCNNIESTVDFSIDVSPYITATMGPYTAVEREKFWREYLKDATPQKLVHRSNKNNDAGNTSSRTEIYHPSLLPKATALISKAKAERISIQSLFFALYAKLHLRHFSAESSNRDLIIGVYLANRSHTLPSQSQDLDLTTLAAPTFNILPLRISFPSSDSNLFAIARQIQTDLSQISSLPNAGASLQNIAAWTHGRVKLDTFLNFLRLPDDSEALSSSALAPASASSEPSTSTVRLTRIDPWTAPDLSIAAAPSPLPRDDTKTDTEAVYEPRAVDVEAALRNGGLDVGIFAPSDIIGTDEANAILTELKEELQALMEERH